MIPVYWPRNGHGSETELHIDNMNWEGFSLIRSWKPLIQTPKEQNNVLPKDK
jgi:hypothetical protein